MMAAFELGTALEQYVKAQSGDPTLHEVRRGEDGQVYIATWEHPFAQPTEPQLEASYLEALKHRKVDEFQRKSREDLVPPFMPRHGVDEAILVLAKTLKGMLEASGQPVPEHITAMVTVGDKAMSKKQQIEAASSEAELEAVSWE